jgi:hypothetical protein
MTRLPNPVKFGYIPRLLKETFNGVCRDFSRLGFDFGVGDIAIPEKLEKFKTVFIPVGEVMAREVQENIVALAEKGVNIILCGLMPRYDESGRDNAYMARKFKIRTTPAEGIVEIDGGKTTTFMGYQYGTIKSTDSKAKKLATVKNKTVGLVSTQFKGKVFMFSYDVASGGDFRKLSYLETILSEAKLSTPVYVSDPNIEIILQKGEKAFCIFVLAPPAGELGDATDIRFKEILLKVDLRKAGFRGTRIKLIDQFADEEEPPIKTTVDEIKHGIMMNIAFPDAKIFTVEKY